MYKVSTRLRLYHYVCKSLNTQLSVRDYISVKSAMRLATADEKNVGRKVLNYYKIPIPIDPTTSLAHTLQDGVDIMIAHVMIKLMDKNQIPYKKELPIDDDPVDSRLYFKTPIELTYITLCKYIKQDKISPTIARKVMKYIQDYNVLGKIVIPNECFKFKPNLRLC